MGRDGDIFYLDVTVLLGILVVTVFLTFPRINWHTSMYSDTALRLWTAQGPWGTVINNVITWELTPPLWHFLAKFLLIASPISDVITLRGLNYVLFLALVPTGYYLGRLIADRETGLIVALLMPWNQYLFNSAIRVDHYLLYGFLSVLLMIGLYRILEEDTNYRWLIFYAGTAILLGFTHYTGFLFVAGTGLFVTLLLLHRHGIKDVVNATVADLRRIRPELNVDLDNASIYPFFLLHVPLLLIYLAWLPFFLEQYGVFTAVPYRTHPFSLSTLWFRISFIGYNLFPTGVLSRIQLAIAAGLVGIVAFVVAVQDIRRTLLVGILAITMGIAIFIGGATNPRHVFFAVTLIPVIVGVTLLYVVRTARNAVINNTAQRGWLVTSAIAVTLLIVLTYGITALTLETPEHRAGDVKAVAEFTESHIDDGTVILVCQPTSEPILDVYGVGTDTPRYGVPVQGVDENHRLNREYRPGVDNIYNPNVSSHRRRLRKAVDQHQTVIVFLSHGFVRDRCTRIVPDVRQLGYHETESITRHRYAAVLLKTNQTHGGSR